jgi:hypothetical protein
MKKRCPAALGAVLALSALMSGCGGSSDSTAATPTTTFMYTSDSHYGIKRGAAFSGYSNAAQVNGALVGVMNTIPTLTLPVDGGVNSGKVISSIDFNVNTGDIANRAEGTKPTANVVSATLWDQFSKDYLNTLDVKKADGTKAPLYLVPGNHDVSNVVGYYKGNMNWSTGNTTSLDDTSYIKIYNAMMNPATPLSKGSVTGADYATTAANYSSKRMVTSRLVNGVLYVFAGMWPDATNRALIDIEIAKAPNNPVVLFTHDQPDIETKHLLNPSATNTGNNAINGTDKFENLVNEAPDSASISGTSVNAQTNMTTWLAAKKNIVAYFHGNDNYQQSYVYTGQPAGTISLPVFRVDSPMKGAVTGNDAADGKGNYDKLSFQVVSVNPSSKLMTVREYLWKLKSWGTSTTTISIAPRTK